MREDHNRRESGSGAAEGGNRAGCGKLLVQYNWAIWGLLMLFIFFGFPLLSRALGWLFSQASFDGLIGGEPLVPAAELVMGEQIAWREIRLENSDRHTWSEPTQYLQLSLGDFDGDGSDELVGKNYHDSWLIELDGTSSRLPFDSTDQLVPLGWDHDNNGVDEVLIDSWGADECAVYDLAGNRLLKLAGSGALWAPTVADFDGDGIDDLQLHAIDNDDKAAYFYTTGGVPLWTPDDQHRALPPFFGDMNGDGVAEMLIKCHIEEENVFHVSGLQFEETVYPAHYDFWWGGEWPTACIDLTGDGVGEVFIHNQAYIDLTTEQVTRFKYPIENASGYSDTSVPALVVDLERNGHRQLATYGLGNFCLNSGVFVFELDGTCEYYEEIGDPIEQMLLAVDATGEEYLVVLTSGRLLIYP